MNKQERNISKAIIRSSNVEENGEYKQIGKLAEEFNLIDSNVLKVITSTFNVGTEEINIMSILKNGMTNHSFLFSIYGDKYIMRIPGEGTDKLINRTHEVEVFRAIKGLGLCDDPIYINSTNGYKITKYLEGIRVCDANNVSDLKKCMNKLKSFHQMRLTVSHSFDIFNQIEFYEALWEGKPSMYNDYIHTKKLVFSLKPLVEALNKDWRLTHIDPVSDNFLFYRTLNGEELQLTDWEYSGMQDPHVDIAMFCIYSLYNKKQVDRLIDIYFDNNCDDITRAKIYAYISICGLLWSNWSEYKAKLGVVFGNYSLRQYGFARDYYKYAINKFGMIQED